MNNPFSSSGPLVILKGNLAPEGAVCKIAGLHITKYRGPARVFNSEEETFDAIMNHRITHGDVVVIRYEGPKGGPGMREMLAVTAALVGQGNGAGAMRGQDGFEVVPGRGAHERTALAGEEIGHVARVGALERRAGEDDRAGVDLVRPKPCGVVREGDEALERVDVDEPIAFEGREQDRRAVDDLALDDDVAARERVREPLQPQAREHDVRGRRTDVDADRREDDVVRLKERLGPARR